MTSVHSEQHLCVLESGARGLSSCDLATYLPAQQEPGECDECVHTPGEFTPSESWGVGGDTCVEQLCVQCGSSFVLKGAPRTEGLMAMAGRP